MMTISTPSAERVRVIVGHPEDPASRMIPVTVHDLDSRRLKYQHAPRDQLAVMNGDDLGEWTAYWSETRQQWTLVDYIGDMRAKRVA